MHLSSILLVLLDLLPLLLQQLSLLFSTLRYKLVVQLVCVLVQHLVFVFAFLSVFVYSSNTLQGAICLMSALHTGQFAFFFFHW